MMLRNKIIPDVPVIYKIAGRDHSLNYEAVATFAALGFFLDNDTFWKDQQVVPPATDYSLNANNELTSAMPYFEWNYSPRDISFETAVKEFTNLFDDSIRKQSAGQIILPLSGGLDSRSIAAALYGDKNVRAYSYHFKGGINESAYGKKIADASGFNYEAFTITPGYLWKDIDRLANINGCYAEFTHPRQMFIFDQLPNMGDTIIAGHGGDLFFDGMGVSDHLPFEQQVDYLVKKLIKKGGAELATALWGAWNLPGNFSDYLKTRLGNLLSTIPIGNANARLRAFKTKYYVSRWTMVNMGIFQRQRPSFLPYFTEEMCRFICSVPEVHLQKRKIQIQYIKNKNIDLAKISWQAQHPFNLLNYHRNKSPYNLHHRVSAKLKRILTHKKFIQRNWELQFLGGQNDRQLRERIFEEPRFLDWIPKELVTVFYNKFKQQNPVHYSHAVSMLLTLSAFSKHHK